MASKTGYRKLPSDPVRSNKEGIREKDRHTYQVGYQSLPAELKTMIWKWVIAQWSSGAHRFCISQNLEDRAKLIINPDKKQADDASAWRERYRLMRIDRYAYRAFLWAQRNSIPLFKETLNRHRKWVEENGVVALVNPSTDLLTFRFNYGHTQAAVALLSTEFNRTLFAGITTIGIELAFFTRGWYHTKNIMPFSYRVGEIGLTGAILHFLENFVNIKTVYIICSATEKNLHEGIPVSLLTTWRLAPLESDPNTHRMSRLGLSLFRHLQEIAAQKGLAQFHDRMGTYCETSDDDVKRVLNTGVSKALKRIRDARDRLYLGPGEALHQCRFGVLVRADLRGVTVSGREEQPIRRNKPW
ncbi:hypothetical protein F5Y14DRAFT_463452 [Nemania sp. NC0429]|nr:hypothetical protein F5Y14DRAFT_463452 [Nemania sp. NC0429]